MARVVSKVYKVRVGRPPDAENQLERDQDFIEIAQNARLWMSSDLLSPNLTRLGCVPSFAFCTRIIKLLFEVFGELLYTQVTSSCHGSIASPMLEVPKMSVGVNALRFASTGSNGGCWVVLVVLFFCLLCVRDEPHCRNNPPLHLCAAGRCLHTARVCGWVEGGGVGASELPHAPFPNPRTDALWVTPATRLRFHVCNRP